MKSIENKSKYMMIMSMIIFGSIGVFRRYLHMPSGMLAMLRGYIGMMVLGSFLWVRGKKIAWHTIKKNVSCLIISGICLGMNWMLLFEAYQYSSVATATLCYYMAPILAIILAVIIFKETLDRRRCVCIFISVIGMILVSGIFTNANRESIVGKGIVFGLGAAVLYAVVMILNKKLQEVNAYDKTIIQLGIAAITLTPYVLIREDVVEVKMTIASTLMLLIIGIVHTGIAYILYFGAIGSLSTQAVALFCYIDPIVAIGLSTLFLKEKINFYEVVGALLILGATLFSNDKNR